MRSFFNIFSKIILLLDRKKEVCVFCKQNEKEDARKLGLCHACYENIVWIQEVKCRVCGRIIHCSDCQKRTMTYFNMHRSAVEYNSYMKKILENYKYLGNERMKDTIGKMAIQAFQLLLRDAPHLKRMNYPYLTFVPIHEKRAEERGFNQAQQISEVISNYTGIPVVSILRRTRNTLKQSKKTRYERVHDLENVFELSIDQMMNDLQRRKKQLSDIDTIIVVDDVYTTGSTLNECAKVIKNEMNVEVICLTWARS